MLFPIVHFAPVEILEKHPAVNSWFVVPVRFVLQPTLPLTAAVIGLPALCALGDENRDGFPVGNLVPFSR